MLQTLRLDDCGMGVCLASGRELFESFSTLQTLQSLSLENMTLHAVDAKKLADSVNHMTCVTYLSISGTRMVPEMLKHAHNGLSKPFIRRLSCATSIYLTYRQNVDTDMT